MQLRDRPPADAGSETRAKPSGPRARTDPVKRFERAVTTVLVALMALVVVLAVIDLAWVLISDLLSPPFALLDIRELLDVFGLFLLVLIGIELLDTLMTYVRDRVIRAEVVLLVAMIALVRKIITIEVTEVASSSLVGIASIVFALGVTYYLLRKSRPQDEARPTEGA